ncbi:MAG: nucleoside monophosphate kinase [Planctomycetales bacterium]|nr:nucleoside monophosphate kinase [Planctomycetales bacterium]
MHKYIVMRAQNYGKGTQARMLQKAIPGLVHISVGDIFRWHMANHTKLAARIHRITSAGNLVDDEIVEEIVKHRLGTHDWNYGFVLDGFPRSRHQAEFFLESFDIDAVIHIVVSDEVVHKRVMSRRLCSGCGLDYNLIYHRPAEDGICDVCGAPLESRIDDTPEALSTRLKEYHEKTEPVLNLFRRKELVLDVDGEKDSEHIHAQICEMLKLSSLAK